MKDNENDKVITISQLSWDLGSRRERGGGCHTTISEWGVTPLPLRLIY